MEASCSLEQETVEQYKNESTLPSVLSRIYGTDLTTAEVKEEGDYIGRKLSSYTLRHLVDGAKVCQWRWRVCPGQLMVIPDTALTLSS